MVQRALFIPYHVNGTTTRRGIFLSNPALAFGFVWVVALWLTDLQLTSILLPLTRSALVLVATNIVTGILLYVPLALYFGISPPDDATETTPSALRTLSLWTRWIGAIWCVGSIIEVVQARGLPLFWIMLGNGRSYTEFGVPMFHGLMQALYMFVLTGVFLEGMLTGKRSRFVWTGGLLLWSVLQVNRGSMMWAILEVAAVWLVLRPVRLRQAVMLLLGVMGVALVFGAIGDIRSQYSSEIIRLILTERGARVFDVLPINTGWLYLYITTPINNLSAVLDKIEPTHVPYFSTQLLFPSKLRALMYVSNFGADADIVLVNDAFNTWTIYLNFVRDWGISGAAFVVALMQGLASYFHILARRKVLWGILAYAPLFQALVLSVFADSFTTLVGVAQVIVTLCFGVAVVHHERRDSRSVDGALRLPETSTI